MVARDTWKCLMISARDFPSSTARSTCCLRSCGYARIPPLCHLVQAFCKPQSTNYRYKGYGAHTEKTSQETAVLDAVIDIAKEQGVTPAQISIAWLLHKAEASTTSIIPILGARKLEQLEEAFEAMNLSLTQEQVERLDVVSQVVLGNPHDIITQSSAQVEGGMLGVLRHPKIPVA